MCRAVPSARSGAPHTPAASECGALATWYQRYSRIGSMFGPSGSIVALIAAEKQGRDPGGSSQDLSVVILSANPIKGRLMKLRKTPIASAVAVALMSVVTPVHAQQSATGPVDTPNTQTQPDATAAQAAKDKDATKPSAAKDAEASADAKT